MDSLYLHAGYARPLRPSAHEHNSQPSISVTSDPDASSKQPRTKHRHHHHHHHHHDRHRRSSTRHHAKGVVQSALQPPTSFGDLLKQARGSKDNSPSHSRKGSISKGGGDTKQEGSREATITIPPPQPIRPEDVELEGKRVEARERDLRAALQSLSEQSLKDSRRLDDIYYFILEKASLLRQTISSLQELSCRTKELHDNFESGANELVDEIQGHVESSNHFEVQQKQIAALEERLKAGKEKADALTARLAEAKERVDARAKTEAQWAERGKRRLQIFWSSLASFAAIILILVLFYKLKPIHIDKNSKQIHTDENSKPTLSAASTGSIMDAPIPDMAKEDILDLVTRIPSVKLKPLPTRSTAGLDADNRLRVFDEL